jgi:hypothetical protein
MNKSSILVDTAEQIAKEVADNLKTNYPGERFSKAEIRTIYRIPFSQAPVVFVFLKHYGFNVLLREVYVPEVASDQTSLKE